MQTPQTAKLYIVMLSIHGLVRGTNMELGRDADTGGQVLYVVELAKALAAHPDVGQVDLLTRQIFDQRVSPDYGTDRRTCTGGTDCAPALRAKALSAQGIVVAALGAVCR